MDFSHFKNDGLNIHITWKHYTEYEYQAVSGIHHGMVNVTKVILCIKCNAVIGVTNHPA